MPKMWARCVKSKIIMKFIPNNYCILLKQEADSRDCSKGNPHCPKFYGDLCEEGCFEVTIDLQTMTIVQEANHD